MGVIFSLHDTFGDELTTQIYNPVKQYGLLDKCLIKSYSRPELYRCYNIFGDSAKYIYIISSFGETQKMFIPNFGHLSYIEFDNYSNNLMTKENVSAVKEYGLKVIGTIANNPLRVSKAIDAAFHDLLHIL